MTKQTTDEKLYYIELIRPEHQGHVYLGWIDKDQTHVVYTLDAVGIYEAEDLPRIYKRLGRKNVIRHTVVPKEVK